MNDLPRNILHCIGDTPLLALPNIAPRKGSRILLKLESENPTGSMKDRMALAMIERQRRTDVSQRVVLSSNMPVAAPACPFL